MPNYTCECCGYYTNHKSKYEKHKLSQKHQKLSQNYHKFTINYHKLACKYCNREFKFSSGLSRHVKYYCKKNKDEDLQELVRLLNEQNKQLKDQMSDEMIKRDKEIDLLHKKIAKLSTKLQINTTMNTNHGIINNNIVLNNYVDTDISHLTDNDFKYLIGEVNHCIPKMIEKVHFNPQVPENMNVYISNMKDKFIMIYKDGTWKLYDRHLEVDKMFDKKFNQISEWLDDHNQFQKLRKCFEKLEENMQNKDIERYIKDEMKLVLYNNRGKLQEIQDIEDTE